MINPYIEYYKNQAGNGMSYFESTRYQRGHGFFGSLFRNILKPLGLYLGKQALLPGVGVGSDILQGNDFEESAKKRFKSTGNQILEDSITRAKQFARTGKGRKRKKRRRKVNLKIKIKKIRKSRKKKIQRKTKKRSKKKSKQSNNSFKHLF